MKKTEQSVLEKGEPAAQRKYWKEYLEPILIAVLIAFFIRTFVVQAFKIPSSSMEPTLLVGDYILVNKFIFGIRMPYSDKIFGSHKKVNWKKPKRGDVIVFIYPEDTSKDFIKRVIATEGEKVDIVGKKIYINDKLIDDPWGVYNEKDNWTREIRTAKYNHVEKVPEDCVLVLGDNRDNSADSRFWGFVNVNAIKGRAFVIYFSWDNLSQSLLENVRWGRLFNLIR
jgi:signal peptidase I